VGAVRGHFVRGGKKTDVLLSDEADHSLIVLGGQCETVDVREAVLKLHLYECQFPLGSCQVS
jgi:hypothetical protein